MVTTNTFEVFYLGSMADIDPDETNFSSENAGDLVGLTFGSTGNPLWQDISLLTSEDTNGDGYVDSNDSFLTPENIVYDGAASLLDSTVEYWVTITYNDGSTATTEMMIIQDESGRVFLSPLQQGDSQNDPLDDLPITSITLDSVSWDNAESMYIDVESDAFIVCFSGGTMIETDLGTVDVARLSVGDHVRTMDHGYQPIRWIGGRRVRAQGNLAPIRFTAGALGENIPDRDLRVSPQHRILLRSKIAQRMFGQSEVLIAAKKLVGQTGITVDQSAGFVTYWHLMFVCHEVVFSNGAATESLLAGPEALKALTPTARGEILALFPDLKKVGLTPKNARIIVHGTRQVRLFARHQKNGQPLFQS